MNKLIGFLRLKPAGVVVPTMVMIMITLTISALAVATFAISHFSRLNTNYFAANTLLTAEAGAEQTLYELNRNSSFSGFNSEQEFFNDTIQGRGTYQTEVVEGSISNEKVIISTGRIYRRPNNVEPDIIRKIRLTVVGTTSSGYSVQTGPGGLIMSNSATIANGEVYVNGYLTMSNSARIGSATNPVKVKVAHANCPLSGDRSSYPSPCTEGQPLSFNNSAHIYGDVCATNQVDNDHMSHTGLMPGCNSPAISLPDHDRAAQVAAVNENITGTAASCQQNQTRTWGPNTKISGDVSVNNNCQVTVLGNVWITGKLQLQNSATVRLADSVTSQPTIMVDDQEIQVQNSASVIANNSNISLQFINYYSKASCSPDCSNVTGEDLYQSRDSETIKISNNTLAAGATFYARWTKIRISNSGSIGRVIGQTVQLDNTGNISFGDELSSGQSIWSIKNYQQIFD